MLQPLQSLECLLLVTPAQRQQRGSEILTALDAGYRTPPPPDHHILLPQRLLLLLAQVHLQLLKKSTPFFKHLHSWGEQVQQAEYHF